MVERRRPQRDDGFAGARLRIVDLLQDQPIGPAEFTENNGVHDG